MKLTNKLAVAMQPTGRIYSAYSIPSLVTNNVVTWANNDDQFIIELDRKTNILSGHFYDWNEETQDWDDANDVAMNDDQIVAAIKCHHLLLVA